MSKLKITLKSDLCVGSGKGFTATIDADVCFDAYGLPYIPTKRIKGALKDAASYIGLAKQTIDAIFGVIGSGSGGALALGNARIAGYDNVKAYFAGVPEQLNPYDILSLFTRVRKNTQLTDGIAEEESLRATRIVNHYWQVNDGARELVFYAAVDLDKQYAADFQQICLALRNIGLHRNRGLGAVECAFMESEPDQYPDGPLAITASAAVINYRLILETPLMLTGLNNNESLNYIPGTSILGALAAKYKQEYPNQPDQPSGGDAFADLFVKDGGPVFSNAYIAGSVPVPHFIVQMKTSNTLNSVFNLAAGEQVNGVRETPKKLKNAYYTLRQDDTGHKLLYQERPIAQSINYHHRRKSAALDEMLYTQHSINAGQIFTGAIRGTAAQLKMLAPLLKGHLRLGRSKTAEYGQCRIQAIACTDNQGALTVNNGAVIAFALVADLILLNDYGVYSYDPVELKEALVEALALYPEEWETDHLTGPGDSASSWPETSGEENLSLAETFLQETSLEANVTGGYYRVWNLQKPHIQSLKAGSVLMLRYNGAKEITIPQSFGLGEKQNEGFGRIMAFDVKNLRQLESFNGPPTATSTAWAAEQVSKDDLRDEMDCLGFIQTGLAAKKKNDQLLAWAVAFATAHKNSLQAEFTASYISNLLLMLRQAKDYADFYNRLNKVADQQKKEQAVALVDDLIAKGGVTGDDAGCRLMLRTVFTLLKYHLRRQKVQAKELAKEGGNE